MPTQAFSLASAVPLLTRTPALLRAWLQDLPDSWTQVNEGAATWSAYDIVGHLNHGERTDWIPRAQIILAQGAQRTFAPFDRFAQERESAEKSLTVLLDEFEQLRAANVATLESWRLTDAELALEGLHPTFGAVSLRQLLATWVTHDLNHIAQMARVMAHQYGDAVGPWKAFLGVLKP